MPLDQRCWCEGENVTIFNRVTNVSPGGAFLRTANPLRCGDRARLVWSSPEGDTAIAEVEVAWTSQRSPLAPSGMGLRLLNFVSGEETWKSLLQRLTPGRQR